MLTVETNLPLYTLQRDVAFVTVKFTRDLWYTGGVAKGQMCAALSVLQRSVAHHDRL